MTHTGGSGLKGFIAVGYAQLRQPRTKTLHGMQVPDTTSKNSGDSHTHIPAPLIIKVGAHVVQSIAEVQVKQFERQGSQKPLGLR